ncbi:MAG: hypothetical protein M3Y18_06035 [Candidatus Eremiobacteraeota bacterium]|nr:hypothetical protein [Candidatus Eremiobacteraeota bacterium]
MRGATELEAELSGLSEEGWEPINFERSSSGEYEVVLRQEREEHTQVVLEQLEASAGEISTPSLTD